MANAAELQLKHRIWLLAFASLAILGLLAVRLGDLQLRQHEYFVAAAEAQRQRASELAPHRGTIYLSESRPGTTGDDIYPVATNRQAWFIYAVPRDMEDPKGIAQKLAPALLSFRQRQEVTTDGILDVSGQLRADLLKKTDEEKKSEDNQEEDADSNEITLEDELVILEQELRDKFDRKTDPFEPIIKPYEVIDEEFRQFLEEAKLDGIVLEEQEVRIYPEGTLASHILGYVGYEESGRVGRYGIEGHWQKNLAGSLGFLAAERDATGGFIGVAGGEFTPAKDGDDIVLTLDRVVQSFIETELEAGIKKFAAERGTIIVMQPKTGAVLGMATWPTFDPNYYYAINDARVQLNPAVSEIFEPGSILKPVVMAAAIEEGLVEPDTTMVDNGPVKVADISIDTFDGKHAGRQTMTNILEHSNNVGMVWVGQQLGAQTQYDYFRRFGLGERTGVELEGETQTSLPEPRDWNITTVATAAFGQGIAMTPLQSLNSINALANGGKLMQPYVVAQHKSPGEEPLQTVPNTVRQVVSPTTAEKLSAMMVSVIENGVAGLARVPGYYLAGKTGTAQVPDERGKYSPDRKIISFVGYGPVEDPQFSILIKLDNPAGLSFASGTAAPMFKNISEKLLQYYQIPPSYDEKSPRKEFTVTSPDA